MVQTVLDGPASADQFEDVLGVLQLVTVSYASSSILYLFLLREQSKIPIIDALRLGPWTKPLACVPIKRFRYAASKQEILFPEPLRRVSYYDTETKRRLVFLTNNCELPAIVSAVPYKKWWQVELFFKWIKQNLRIHHFFGTSEDAVKTQVWIAIAVYVLVVIVRKALKLEMSPSKLLQSFSVTHFENTPLIQWEIPRLSRGGLQRSTFAGIRQPAT